MLEPELHSRKWRFSESCDAETANGGFSLLPYSARLGEALFCVGSDLSEPGVQLLSSADNAGKYAGRTCAIRYAGSAEDVLRPGCVGRGSETVAETVLEAPGPAGAEDHQPPNLTPSQCRTFVLL